MLLRLIIFVFCVHLLWANPIWSADLEIGDDTQVFLSEEERRKKFWTTTLVGAGVVTVWGVVNWDYFTKSPNAESEGWFGNDTESGGADKIGHAYTTYAFSHAISILYEHWGFEQKNAALYGALSSYAIMTYMELGDAFSDFGTSYEDLIANTVGAVLGYVLYSNDDLASKIDFRWEYDWSFSDLDIFTDYENSKYLLALKLNGFEVTKNTLWKHIEFHLGYYTRNFDSALDGDKERNIYVGIGFNLTDLLYRNSWKKTGTVLRYIQIPYTSINAEHDFND
jgi:hypothetical protein